MNIINLGKLIDPAEFTYYIEAAEQLETVVHGYGTKLSVPSEPCWMEYRNEGNVLGSISFSRHTDNHPVLVKMVKRVAEILTSIFPENYPPEESRIHLIRTRGSVPIHKDEAGRLTCLNIGLKNSAEAVTHMGSGGAREDFFKNCTSTTLQDGYGYLVNTSEFHSVSSVSDNPRYLITYGLGKEFNYFKQFIRISNGEKNVDCR
jgi:hypothetical protein